MELIDKILAGGIYVRELAPDLDPPDVSVSRGPSLGNLLSRRLPGFDVLPMGGGYKPDVLLYVDTEQERLQALYFRFVVQDSSADSPFARFLAGISEELSGEAPGFAVRRNKEYWVNEEPRLQAKYSDERFEKLVEANPEAEYEHLRTEAESYAGSMAARIVAYLANEDPSEYSQMDALRELVNQFSEDQEWLEGHALKAIEELGASRLPNGWLISRLVWEAKAHLDSIRSRSFGNDPSTSEPPWRRPDPPKKRREGVSVFLNVEESDEEHRRKFDEAVIRVKQMRGRRTGRLPWDGKPPSEEGRFRALYRYVLGESCSTIVANSPELTEFNARTVQRYLNRLRDEVFLDEPDREARDKIPPAQAYVLS